MPDRFDNFTERARRVLKRAQDESNRFNHQFISPEHLLLGLVSEGDGVAARVLVALNAEPARIRSAVESWFGSPTMTKTQEEGLTSESKHVIALAVEQAEGLGHYYINTEHLLLGLLLEDRSQAAHILADLGVHFESALAKTEELFPRQPAATD